ncbi:unnamed protein product [Gulo gulo]|uniref:Nuclear transport factor 2 domain-containing protein n=1 Tax=Gulo gulo TaxID=48420 RepID=A0A9X9LNH1_GULGU|nr:unnamed protein product [Gulo gulo]
MKKLKDPSLCVQPLKHTKCDIVGSLCVLPKTQHDLSSFLVDMWFQTEKMLCFSVNGVFKEGECAQSPSPNAPLLSPRWLGSLSELSQLP